MRRAHRAPRRRALPAPVRHHGPLAAVRRRDPRPGPPAGRARQGRRHRDVLHVRRPDRRAVVARAAAADALRHRPRRPDPARHPGLADVRRRAARRYEELAGKTTFSAREAVVAGLRETGDLDGEPVTTQRKANFYEKGDKPLEIVTSRQWYIRNGGRDEDLRAALLARGAELGFNPEFMRVRYENWVSGLNGDWLVVAAAVLRRAVPRLVPARRGRRARSRRARCSPTEDQLPIDPSSDVPAGYTADQRGVPGGFVGRPRHHGHLGHQLADPADRRRLAHATPTCSAACSPWTCAPRARTSSAPGCSRRWSARTWSTARCRGPTRPSAAGSSTPTARRCRSPRATWSRP